MGDTYRESNDITPYLRAERLRPLTPEDPDKGLRDDPLVSGSLPPWPPESDLFALECAKVDAEEGVHHVAWIEPGCANWADTHDYQVLMAWRTEVGPEMRGALWHAAHNTLPAVICDGGIYRSGWPAQPTPGAIIARYDPIARLASPY